MSSLYKEFLYEFYCIFYWRVLGKNIQMYKIQKYEDGEGMIKIERSFFDAHDVVKM